MAVMVTSSPIRFSLVIVVFATVDAGSVSQITLECPSGTVPMAANWFVNGNGDAGSHGDVSANASGPTIGDRALTIVLKNSGTSAVAVGEHLLCIEGRALIQRVELAAGRVYSRGEDQQLRPTVADHPTHGLGPAIAAVLSPTNRACRRSTTSPYRPVSVDRLLGDLLPQTAARRSR
jgi:hypothetical protein